MEWPLKTAEKDLVSSFENFIVENKDAFCSKRIFIWGASVRGTLFGILLEKYGIKDFFYLDNDERKWGTNIKEHEVIRPDEAKKNLKNIYIIIPLEYATEVCTQLRNWGLGEREFATVASDVEKNYTDEFYREYNNDRLILGETFLNETIIDENNAESIKECLWKKYKKENTKILAMNCMGMQGFYHMLRLQILQGKAPKETWVFVNFETLTEYHHILSRTQHPDLLKLIAKTGKIQDKSFERYIEQADKRARNYKIEMQYSPQRTFEGKNVDHEVVQKEYMKMQLLHPLSLETVELVYFKKILELFNRYRITGCIINIPINYQLAEKLYPGKFVKIYEQNRTVLKKMVEDYKCTFWDMGNLLEEKDFAATVTINDAVYQSGRNKIMRYLDDREEKK